jgi:hypothetical protein
MKSIKYLIVTILLSQFAIAQSIVIGSGSSIEVGLGSDICAGVYGNITGNLFGEGTQCNQSAVTTFQLAVNIINGWNMVSIPGLHPVDQNVNTWWQYRDPGANVFKYSGSYQQVTTATPGIGYWMKHAGARTYNTGDEWPAGGIQIVAHDPIPGTIGWNLIGGYEASVATSGMTTTPPGLIVFPVYKYSGGYQVATTLDPGYGYWVKLSGAGQINIPGSMAKGSLEIADYFPSEWGRIIFTDNAGNSYVLYAADEKTDLSIYELPPAPPSGMFDIRFGSGRIAEDINKSVQTIELSGVQYPLTVRVENMSIRLQDGPGNHINKVLKTGEDIVINDATLSKLTISKDKIPETFALEQNYPNPFNPSTTISFALPQATQLKIKVYNMLGEQVNTIAEGMYDAGYHKVTFNASNLPSGTYIYRLESNDFVQVRKMILIK